MAIGRVSLSKVLDKDFVTTIQKMAVKAGAVSSSSSATSTDWSSTLQGGARIYANSVSALNSLISYLNVSKETLGGLLDITNGMLELADKAKSTSVGNQTRKRLDVKYNELVKDFKEIVKKADESDRNFLTKDGLSKLFSIIGLDTETSKTIAEVFGEFIFEGENEILASEDIKPKKQAVIPRQAYGKVATSETSKYSVMQVSSNNQNNNLGAISNNNNIVASEVDGNQTLSFISNVTGEKNILGGDGYQYKLKDVSSESGFAIVSRYESQESNSDLFLTDNKGNIIKQLTNESLNYTDVKMSSDSRTIIFSSISDDNVEKIQKLTFSDFDEEGVLEEIASKNDVINTTYTNLQVSKDGSYIAYRDSENAQNFLLESDGLIADSDFSNNLDVTKFGFIGSNTLAVYDGNNISSYEYGTNVFNTIKSDVNIDKFATINNNSDGNSYIAYSIVDTNDVNVINSSGTQITTYQVSQTDNIENLSLTYNNSDVVELGVFGTLTNVSNDSDLELYRFSGENSTKYSRTSKAITKVFDSGLNLKSVADAYRVSNALTALKDQLENNIKTMDKMFDVIGSNLELVRATGYALLDLSQEALTSDTAETIAKKLRREITKNASQALSQANNLEPLAVASMMLNDEI